MGLKGQYVKGFILPLCGRKTGVCRAWGYHVEMSGDVFTLQNRKNFSSIGHSFAALAFVVSGSIQRRQEDIHGISSCLRTAYLSSL